MTSKREHTLAQIRARRALGLVARRKRIPRQQQPDGVRIEYLREINGYLNRAISLFEREVFPVAREYVEASAREHERGDRFDADGRKFNAAADRAGERFFAGIPANELEAVGRKFAMRTSDFQKTQLDKQVRAAIGIDYSALVRSEPDLNRRVGNFIAENVSLIKSVPTRYFDEVEKEVGRAATKGVRWETLAKRLEKELPEKYGANAALIARDQIGKFNGAMNEARQQALGATHYIWQTSNDGRVRPEHEERQGESYAWASPPEDGHPGFPINCRCYAEPDFSSLLESLRGK